jgi:hypothetical protein
MSEQRQQTIGQEPPELHQDLPEVELPSQACDPQANSGVVPDLSSLLAATAPPTEDAVEIDLTIGVGEDPGWHRAARWRGERPCPAPGR